MSWRKLGNQEQSDLLEWFNVCAPSREDKARLAKLFHDRQFGAWDCPECGERCYHGAPDNWGHFQGVCQVDYVSYPVTESRLISWCDSCRSQGMNYKRPGNIVGVPPWDMDEETLGNSA